MRLHHGPKLVPWVPGRTTSELVGDCQSQGPCPFPSASEVRPLPSAGVTRLHRYYGPVRHPVRPGLALAGCRLVGTRHHRRGFLCCAWSPCACMPSPLPRRDPWVHPSLAFPRDGSLPRIVGGSAPALPVSRPARRSLLVTACLLAESPGDPYVRRLQRLRYLHRCSDCYRLERPLPGGIHTR